MITDIRKFAMSNGISGMTYDDYVSKTFKNAYVEPTVIEERNMASMTSIGVYSRLLMDRIIFLGTEVNDDVANIMTAQLLWLEQQSDSDIQLMINSVGGSVYDGLQIIDTMNFIKPEVVTTITGLSASMAAVIATCGSKGKRSALPHSRFMIHQVIGGAYGQCADIQIRAAETKKLQNELYKILSENSNYDVDAIEKMADRDNWMNAEEAVNGGFIDNIIKSKKN